MNFKKVFINWLPLALAITMLCVVIEVAVQQSYRMSANDPQIQYSEDTAANFKSGTDSAGLVPQEKTNIAASLSTFGIIYNKDGGLLASSATLDNQTPALPKGVLDYAAKHGRNLFTWQPQKGVRIAAVVTKADGGYVLIGRNIREIEKRETNLDLIVLAGWLGTLLATLAAALILEYLGNKKPSKKAEKTI